METGATSSGEGWLIRSAPGLNIITEEATGIYTILAALDSRLTGLELWHSGLLVYTLLATVSIPVTAFVC